MPTSNFSLFKKNGYYYTRFTVDGKRKQRSTRTTNKAEALKALGETDPPRFPQNKNRYCGPPLR